MVYKIHNRVEFSPEENRLTPLTSEGKEIIINSPASRCFLLLIMNHGKVVSQDDFFEYVWHKKGMHVSANTFYQNISILRRGLKTAGITEEIVLTVPKKGMLLGEAILVEPIKSEDEGKKPSAANIVHTKPLQTSTLVESEKKSFPFFNRLMKKLTWGQHLYRKLILYFLLFIFFTAVLLYLIIGYFKVTNDAGPISNNNRMQTMVKKIGYCYFYNNDQDSSLSFNATRNITDNSASHYWKDEFNQGTNQSLIFYVTEAPSCISLGNKELISSFQRNNTLMICQSKKIGESEKYPIFLTYHHDGILVVSPKTTRNSSYLITEGQYNYEWRSYVLPVCS